MSIPLKSVEPQRPHGCRSCRDKSPISFDFTMAFQPIVDTSNNSVFAYESLVRGKNGAGANAVMQQVNHSNRYKFDQACRVKAVELAAKTRLSEHLSINFLPNAVYQPEACIRTTLRAAEKYNFPIEKIIFEVTENENITDKTHIKKILESYKKQGFKTAIDDFGAGYSGLNLLADFQPDIIKIDMELIRNIHKNRAKQVISRSIVALCKDLNIQVIAEGIECIEELQALQETGINLFQGYLFAKPELEALPHIVWP
ncbi:MULTISPECIES: EAL domain-containing protein [Pseudomonas]|uniref:EAL domain-containing protein n=1 Tax=Pseudomonas TaxID=286 RepID=UPI0018A89788|nr:EAL domain-containing protein [Pseudomonas guariconensis]